MSHVFVSYVHDDAAEVDRLSDYLKNGGVKVWIDREEISPGEDWKAAIRKAIQRGAFFLACFSSEYEKRPKTFMNRELNIAIEELQLRPTDQAWFIPILLSPCKVPDRDIGGGKTLNDLQRVYLYKDWNRNATKLLEVVQSKSSFNPLIVVGSGNGDFVLTHRDPVMLGTKNFVDSQQLLGGSGLNASTRLLAAGYDAVPILSVGRDRLGYSVAEELRKTALAAGVSAPVVDLLDCDSFFAPGVTTPQSTIVVDRNRRTIFAEKLRAKKRYLDRIIGRLEEIEKRMSKGQTPEAVMIGHIHTDGTVIDGGRVSVPGESTKYLINRYCDRCGVFLNFGRNQIDLGAEFWEEHLKRVRTIQLNQREAKRFFRSRDVKSTIDAISWCQLRGISCIITFGRFGAIASFGSGEDGVVLALPILQPEEVIDTTGAGDAFAAGMVSVLAGVKTWAFAEFFSAIKVGRLWAAFACTELGASHNPPNTETLRDFSTTIRKRSPPLEIVRSDRVKERFEMIDAFSNHAEE